MFEEGSVPGSCFLLSLLIEMKMKRRWGYNLEVCHYLYYLKQDILLLQHSSCWSIHELPDSEYKSLIFLACHHEKKSLTFRCASGLTSAHSYMYKHLQNYSWISHISGILHCDGRCNLPLNICLKAASWVYLLEITCKYICISLPCPVIRSFFRTLLIAFP